MNSEARRVLEAWALGRKNDFVFYNPETGKPFVDLKAGFALACRKAGISGVSWHTLRHTFASRLVERRVDIVTVQQLLGRSTVTVTIAAGIIRYHKFKIITPAEMARALEILADDLAMIDDPEETMKIRTRVEGYGLQIPEPEVIVHIPPRTIAFTLETDGSTGHPAVQRSLPGEAQSGVTEVRGQYKGLTSPDEKGAGAMIVHPAAALGAQDKEKTPASKTEDLCTGCVKGCLAGAVPPPVQRNVIPTSKASPHQELEQSGAVHKRLKLAYTQSAGKTQIEENAQDRRQVDSHGAKGSWARSRWPDNRVPPAIEAAVFEKFQQGWNKSKLAREFRLNRRTVIRICRDREATK